MAQAVASLRARLLGWILLPLAGLITLNAWVAYGNAVEASNEAYDRALYLASRALAEELVWRQGALQVNVLRAAGYLLENHTGSRLYYRVGDAAGRHLAGDPTLPAPQAGPAASVRYHALVQFEDGELRGRPVRLAHLTHVLEDEEDRPHILKISVAETLETRQQMVRQQLRETLVSQGLLLLAAALLVVVGVQRGIRPLEHFRQRLAARDDDDFSPIAPPDLPRELHPLVNTLNGYLARLGRLIDIRKRFLDNAAHQLRTPLTVLKTQLALADRDPVAVAAARQTTDDAVRLTEQLLAMTRAEHASALPAGSEGETVDLLGLARQVTQEYLPRALQQGDDFGFEARVDACRVPGTAALLHDALGNLVDNALHHTPPGTRITVRVGPRWVEVEDHGPGIATEHQAHVFERFYRAAPASVRGSGLGLAIAREIAQQQGATLTLRSPAAPATGAIFRIEWKEG
ncbi:MAG: sensor histidine kinase N-terminal domain-containing protein [Hylemonella sp.]|uniref:sensor histidine kinase n=1 Tax=Hylemonella sp. TaxID=2066020 RepID=UPI0022BFDF47|nr:sensor histidine kinase N-terminal domain-containing protein [Hylemonella sp.]MCZ8252590.1 sensor histidine kinase N-terminal domain-containing protein [Hylemonella sp.]